MKIVLKVEKKKKEKERPPTSLMRQTTLDSSLSPFFLLLRINICPLFPSFALPLFPSYSLSLLFTLLLTTADHCSSTTPHPSRSPLPLGFAPYSPVVSQCCLYSGSVCLPLSAASSSLHGTPHCSNFVFLSWLEVALLPPNL